MVGCNLPGFLLSTGGATTSGGVAAWAAPARERPSRAAAKGRRKSMAAGAFLKRFLGEGWVAGRSSVIGSSLIGDARFMIADDLPHGFGLHGQLVLVGLEPGEEVRLDRVEIGRAHV